MLPMNDIDSAAHRGSERDLDKIDRRILRVLQADGRISNLKLAETVHLSPTAVLERVKRLTREGYILGYEARLNPLKLGAGLLVFVEILLDRTVPKIAVPTRTSVAPSATAASRSALMPIDKVSSARPRGPQFAAVRAARGAARAGAWHRGRARGWPSARAAARAFGGSAATAAASAALRPAPAALAGLAADVDLQAQLQRRQAGGRCSARRWRSSGGRRCAPSRRPRPRRGSCCSAAGRSGATRWRRAQVGQRVDLGQRLLHVVLAEGRWPAAWASRTASAPKVLLTASSVTLCGCAEDVDIGAAAAQARRCAAFTSCRLLAMLPIMPASLSAGAWVLAPCAARATSPMDITQLLAFSVKNKASDLHLSAGLPPMIRVHGDVRRINVERWTTSRCTTWCTTS
jgi:hypothetical protein